MSQYEDYLASLKVEDDKRNQVVSSLSEAATTNPDEFANMVKLSRAAKISLEAVPEYKEEAQQAKFLGDVGLDRLWKDAPKTTQFLATPDHAKMASDDIENLSGIEGALRIAKNSGRALAAVIPRINEGIYGAAAAPFELLGIDSVGGYLRDQQKNSQAWGKHVGPQGKSSGNIESGFYSGITSAGQNLLSLPLAFLPGGQGAALAAMTIPVFGESYGKGRDAGLSPAQSIQFGTQDAAAEYVFERYGLGNLVKNVKSGTGLGKTVVQYMMREVPSEMATTVVQSFNEYANINPGKPVGEWLAQLPDELAQTVVATLVGGAAISTSAKAVQKTMQIVSYRQQEAQDAERGAGFIETLNKFIGASTTLQRDPETFEKFIAQATEDGPVENVYVNAQTLQQSGIAEQLAQVSPAVAEQLQTALETGGDIRIPVAEYASKIAPTEFAQSLVDHLKVDENGFSRAEAQEYMQSQGAELQSHIERIMAENEGDTTFKASVDAVKENIRSQLDTANRFTPQNNEAFSTLTATFFATTAARLGMTPEALYEKYPLRVVAESIAGQQFEQGGTLRVVDDAGNGNQIDSYDDKKGLMYRSNRLPTGIRWTVFEAFPAEEGGNQVLGEMFKYKSLEEARASVRGLRISATQKAKNSAKYGSIPNTWKGEEKKVAKAMIDAGIGIERFASSTQSRSKYIYLDSGLKVRLSDHTLPGTYDQPDVDYRYGGDIKAIVEEVKIAERDAPTPDSRELSSPTQIKSATGNRGTFDPNDANILNQQARASFNPATLQISLLKSADLSSFLHESGHFFLEVQFDLAAQLQREAAIHGADTLKEGEQEYLRDTQAVLDWFGINDLNEWNNLDFEEKRSYHERYAESFEAYLFSGKAPSIELAPLFQKFRAFLTSVYTSLKNFLAGHPEAGKLNEEVIAVFDKMLATNEQIMLAEQARSMMPLFDANDGTITPEEYASLQALGIAGTNEAIQELQAKGLRDLQWARNAKSKELRRLQRESKDIREELTMQARREVMSQPVYQVWSFLTNKESLDELPSNNQPALSAGRLDMAGLSEIGLPADIINHLKVLRMTAKDGLHPDMVAEVVGNFGSGDEMVRAIVSAKPPKEAIADRAQELMEQNHGELANEEAIDRAADKAIHNEVRARAVEAELNALAKAMNVREPTGNLDKNGKPITRPVLATAAREFAAQMIGRLKIRDIKPSQYANSEAKAARSADKSKKAGDVAQAMADKRNQLINLYLTRAAYNGQDEAGDIVRYLSKFDRDGTRKALARDYLVQIDAILERFDLRKGQSLKAIDKRESLAKFIESQVDAGIEPEIPDWLVLESNKTHYKNLTLDELRAVNESVRQIEHLGRLKNKLLTAKDARELNEIVQEITESMIANSAGEVDNEARNTVGSKISQMWRGAMAAHRKAASVVREMDGFKDGGPMWEYFIRSMNEAGEREATMRAEAAEKLHALAKPVMDAGKLGGKGKYFPALNRNLNRGEILAMALNIGNESNLQRLLGGKNWTVGQIKPALDTLSATDWAFVQGVWDFFESYRPQIGAKQMRVYGTEPDWIEAGNPFLQQLSAEKGLSLRGGYYPVKYDPRQSGKSAEFDEKQAAQDMMRAANTAATTRRSFTKSRVDEVKGRPLLLRFDGIWQGANEVIHDLTWHEWLIDANRLMKRLDEPMRNQYGHEYVDVLRTSIKDSALGDMPASNRIQSGLNHLRIGATVAGLGWNLTTSLLQPIGLTQSVVRIGAPWVARGLRDFYSNPLTKAEEVQAKSEFMRNRGRTFMREINDVRNRLESDKSAARSLVESSFFVLIQKMQATVDYPTWLGAYEKAITDDSNDEARAIGLADQAVIDSQGGGQIKDLAEVQRGHPMMKLFTNFYSFFNVALNLSAERTKATNFRKPAEVAALAGDYLLLLVLPSAIGAVLKSVLKGGDDDEEKLLKKIAEEQIGFLLGLFVGLREITSGVQMALGVGNPGIGYSGPAGARFFAEMQKLGQQIGQGEADMALFKAANSTAGILFHYPAGQVNRAVEGSAALIDGRTNNPLAPLVGPPPKN